MKARELGAIGASIAIHTVFLLLSPPLAERPPQTPQSIRIDLARDAAPSPSATAKQERTAVAPTGQRSAAAPQPPARPQHTPPPAAQSPQKTAPKKPPPQTASTPSRQPASPVTSLPTSEQQPPDTRPREAAKAPSGTETPTEDRAARSIVSSESGTSGAAGKPAAVSGIVEIAQLKVLKKTAAEYPAISRKRKDQGRVVLLVDIAAGKTRAARVETSSGHKPLDESALKAVRSWTFDTGSYGDRVTARVPFVFSLK